MKILRSDLRQLCQSVGKGQDYGQMEVMKTKAATVGLMCTGLWNMLVLVEKAGFNLSLMPKGLSHSSCRPA
jgi:hypothetical protein